MSENLFKLILKMAFRYKSAEKNPTRSMTAERPMFASTYDKAILNNPISSVSRFQNKLLRCYVHTVALHLRY